MVPEPELIIRPMPEARHAKVAAALRETKYAGIRKFGFDGNEDYHDFQAAELLTASRDFGANFFKSNRMKRAAYAAKGLPLMPIAI